VYYLSVDDALQIHRYLIRDFGGASGVRDLGLIESALLRPQTGYYADLIEEGAALGKA
jgi:death-on-curing protein